MGRTFQTDAEKALAQHVYWATGDWPEESKRNLVTAIATALESVEIREREACARWAEEVISNGVVVLSAAEVGDAIRNRS